MLINLRFMAISLSTLPDTKVYPGHCARDNPNRNLVFPLASFPDRLTAGHQVLVLSIGVRIPVREPHKNSRKILLFLCCDYTFKYFPIARVVETMVTKSNPKNCVPKIMRPFCSK